MSIQEGIHNGIAYKVCSKLKLTNLYDFFLIIFQFLSRKSTSLFNSKKNDTEVFFVYYNHYTHPDIKKRYYGKKAPLYWNTLKKSEVVHCIQWCPPNFLGKKVILEPNDHTLVIGRSLGISEPHESVKRCNEISDYISSKSISRILIGNNELINHAKYYFSNSALKKFFIYPEFSCVPRVNEYKLKEKNRFLSSNHKIRFLSIASNFRKKAVGLLIEAFLESKVLGDLTLVCHDIPDNIQRKIINSPNIKLIEDIPLSKKKKDYLYLNSDVYINTTCIDGGAVAVNALEYGLPIITHTYHRGASYIKNKNGVLLSEPMKYYDPKSYGINWNSIPEFLDQVDLLVKKGGYVDVQKQLINALKYYENEPNNILNEGLKSLELAKQNSLEKSNSVLRNLYKQVASE